MEGRTAIGTTRSAIPKQISLWHCIIHPREITPLPYRLHTTLANLFTPQVSSSTTIFLFFPGANSPNPSASYSKSVLMTTFQPPSPTGLPSWSSELLASPCGKTRTAPCTGAIGHARRLHIDDGDGRKKVVAPGTLHAGEGALMSELR